jgi:hypothetical protein
MTTVERLKELRQIRAKLADLKAHAERLGVGTDAAFKAYAYYLEKFLQEVITHIASEDAKEAPDDEPSGLEDHQPLGGSGSR